MAIFHLSVKVFSRSKGHSAVAASSYRAGVDMRDERDGQLHEYAGRRGVVREVSELVLPKGAPRWSRSELWNAAERSENRKNSCVGREVEVSLPHELPAPMRLALAREFTSWLVDRYGFAAECNIHEPTPKSDDPRNYHAHIQTSTRRLTPEGFGEKVRVLDAIKTGSVEITTWREEWARRVNAALAKHGSESRIDHRSNADQGLAQLPTVHIGHGPRAPEREALNVEIQAWNGDARTLINERARVEAVIEFERQLAETREALATMNAEVLTIKQQLDRARPAREVGQARAQANEMRRAIEDKQTTVKSAREQLEALPWWRMLARRSVQMQLQTGRALLTAWQSDYREIKQIAKSPVRDELAKRQIELNQEREKLILLRDELMEKIALEESKNIDYQLQNKRLSSAVPP